MTNSESLDRVDDVIRSAERELSTPDALVEAAATSQRTAIATVFAQAVAAVGINGKVPIPFLSYLLR